MTAPTTSIRWTLTQRILDTLRQHDRMVGVQVEAGWPGDEVQAECVWLDELAGDVNIPVMTGGRKQRDDLFTLSFLFRVANRVNKDETLSRVIELTSALGDILADDPTLDDFDGNVSVVVTHERQTATQGPEGHMGFGVVDVTAHSRLE